MPFVGLNLHERDITACALDVAGGVVAEGRRLPVSLKALGDVLAARAGPVTVGMAATHYWPWLHDQREALGHSVCVADARQVKLIGQTRPGPVGHASNRWLKWMLVAIGQTLKQAPGPKACRDCNS